MDKLGAVRERLERNGYKPTSVVSHFVSQLPGSMPVPAYLSSDDVAAIELWPKLDHGVAVLVLVDQARRLQINAVLKRLKLDRGPMRRSADGTEQRPLYYDGYNPPLVPMAHSKYRMRDGAMILECCERGQWGVQSGILRLDGEWSNGTLLDTPRTSLPKISHEEIGALFDECNRLPSLDEPLKYEPSPPRKHVPTERELELAELRRDPEKLKHALWELTGNNNAQQALLASIRNLDEPDLVA